MWLGILIAMSANLAPGGNPTDALRELLPRGLPLDRPVVVAHRGGVVGLQAPECSPAAISGAAATGYDMVELDVRSTRDGIPLILHEEHLEAVCGITGMLAELDSATAESLRFVANGESVLTLRQALERCCTLRLGVMLDIKSEGNDVFFQGIRDALHATGYEGRALCINRAAAVLASLSGAVLFRVDEAQAAKLAVARDTPLEGAFWFGLPEKLPDELVGALKSRGILVLPAINTFRYDARNHQEEARADIDRLRHAGVDGFQIDSCYQQYFGLGDLAPAK